MYKRFINLDSMLSEKSHFLFGPRQVGKSTAIEVQLPNAYLIDLLDSDQFDKYMRRPRTLGEELENRDVHTVVIDEIQKLPQLLDEVQRLLKQKKWVFLLTGSSARQLKKRGTNLLGGRAWTASMHPLTSYEIDDFDLIRYLNAGGLPDVYQSKVPQKELKSYAQTYLKQEIQDEALVRQLRPFAQFLDIMGRSNGAELNYTNIAQSCQVSDHTVRNYVEILEDTLLAFRLPAFTKSLKRKPISRSKFYFFDVGLAVYLAKYKQIDANHPAFGACFEHFVINEVRAFLNYSRLDLEVSYWRSKSGYEVDLLIGGEIAIEVKTTQHAQEKHLKGLRALRDEGVFKNYILICMEKTARQVDGIEILPWQDFMTRLWSQDLIK